MGMVSEQASQVSPLLQWDTTCVGGIDILIVQS